MAVRNFWFARKAARARFVSFVRKVQRLALFDPLAMFQTAI